MSLTPKSASRARGAQKSTWLKKNSLMFLGALFALVTLATGAAGQGGATRVDTPAASQGADTRYRIGAGDVLSIQVRKAPELSGIFRVDQRGKIRLPMVEGEVQAACHTESELEEKVKTLYLEYKRNPIVDVFVNEFNSRPVAVVGAIGSPGQFRLQRQVRLAELLSLAGGPTPRAGRTVNIIHAGGPDICASGAPQSGTAEELSMFRLIETFKGNPEANPFVKAGDIVAIPEADQVFVIGHVMSPQAIFLRDKPITISRAIASAGGTARDASTKNVRIIRQAGDGVSQQTIIVDLKAVMKLEAADIALVPNDIVEVPGSTSKSILGALTGAIAPTLTQVPIRMIP